MEQVKKCVDAGAEIVRITVQGKREAAACMEIREALFKDKCAPAASHVCATPPDIVCEHDEPERFLHFTVTQCLMAGSLHTEGEDRISVETASSVVMLRLAIWSVSCPDRLTAHLPQLQLMRCSCLCLAALARGESVLPAQQHLTSSCCST